MTPPHETPVPASTPPPDLVAPFGGRASTADLDGPVYWVDFGGPSPQENPHARDVVLVHGLGGNHLNWVQVAPALAEQHRVRVLDLPGFGFSPAGLRAATVQANADIVARFVTEVVGGPATLVGNSMGGLICALTATRHPAAVERLVLVDPAIPMEAVRPDALVATSFALYSVPRVGEVLVRRLNRASFRARARMLLELCFGDPARIDERVAEATIKLLTARRHLGYDSETAFLQAARSLMRQIGVGRAGYRALLSALRVPVLLIHGEADRLVPVAGVRRVAAANPGWQTEYLAGVGHTPMMEVPEDFLRIVRPFLEGDPAADTAAAERATG